MRSTRSLVYKGMVYKGFFRPSTGFPEKIRVSSTGSGRLKGFRKYVSIEAQANPQHFSLYLRKMNPQVLNNLHYECKSLKSKDKEIFQKIMNVCLKAFLVKSEGTKC